MRKLDKTERKRKSQQLIWKHVLQIQLITALPMKRFKFFFGKNTIRTSNQRLLTLHLR